MRSRVVYLEQPGERRKIVHSLGRFEFEGGKEVTVPGEIGGFLRHLNHVEGRQVFFVSDIPPTERIEVTPITPTVKRRRKVIVDAEEDTGQKALGLRFSKRSARSEI